jgi:hypothetical protein
MKGPVSGRGAGGGMAFELSYSKALHQALKKIYYEIAD